MIPSPMRINIKDEMVNVQITELCQMVNSQRSANDRSVTMTPLSSARMCVWPVKILLGYTEMSIKLMSPTGIKTLTITKIIKISQKLLD